MKAWNLHEVGDIRFEEVDKPQIKNTEVLVRIKAVGVCGSDIPRIYKDGAHHMPLIIGHEFAGVVEEVGADLDEAWKNTSVGVFPLIPCMECECCKKKQYEMCRNYSYIGSRQNGAFAEYVAVPEWNLIKLPGTVSFEEAAMLEPMAVAVHAIRRVSLSDTDTVVVCGAGTIGMLLIMFLLEKGIRDILVIGNKDFQKKNVIKLGIQEDHYCDSKSNAVVSWIMEKTGRKGADAFFECVGKEETYEEAIEAVKPSGKVCLVGNPYGDMKLKQSTYWKILRNQLTVTGTWNSSFTHNIEDDWHYVLERLANGIIHPSDFISHKYSLEDIVNGFEIMRDKKEDYIKIMAINM